MIELVESHLKPTMHNPIPKKLKAYAKGRLALSRERIDGYFKKMRKNLHAMQLEILKGMVITSYWRNYPQPETENKNWEHAISVLSFIDRNRRGFKRFIKAHAKGNTGYLLNHPRTKEWINKHPGIDIQRWTQGINDSYSTRKYGPITLTLEKDPLEALKLGTYMGTCLGIGGGLAYSAVAVMLDINKQVIYARNEKNEIVARQLLAISEEEQLICFSVYPESEDKKIAMAFRQFDRKFAKKLGITTYREKKDEEYTIQSILSSHWWDDLAWNLRP